MIHFGDEEEVPPLAEHADTLSLNALRSLVTVLVEQVNALKTEGDELRREPQA